MVDGKSGQLLAKQIEAQLRSHVIGSWLDLGFFNWYSTSKPLNSYADLEGLKIRNNGGAGQAWRTQFMGAIPNTTPLPNVALALSQGTFDGLITSHETVASGQFWESGIRHSLEDHQFIGEYIPMVSLAFWQKLSADLQQAFTALWQENVSAYRANMATAQSRARELAQSHGISIVEPSPDELEAKRRVMMIYQGQVGRSSRSWVPAFAGTSGVERRFNLVGTCFRHPESHLMMRTWDRVEKALVGVLGLAALAFALWQVLSRYFFPRQSISYAEEVIVYLVIWAIMIVSSQLVRTDSHVRPDLVLKVVPAGVARWMEVFNCLAAIVFCAALVWYGRQVVEVALLIDERSASDLRFPMWVYYAALPAGGLLMLIRYIVRLAGLIARSEHSVTPPGRHELPGID